MILPPPPVHLGLAIKKPHHVHDEARLCQIPASLRQSVILYPFPHGAEKPQFPGDIILEVTPPYPYVSGILLFRPRYAFLCVVILLAPCRRPQAGEEDLESYPVIFFFESVRVSLLTSLHIASTRLSIPYALHSASCSPVFISRSLPSLPLTETFLTFPTQLRRM